MKLELKNLTKRYGDPVALDSLSIETGAAPTPALSDTDTSSTAKTQETGGPPGPLFYHAPQRTAPDPAPTTAHAPPVAGRQLPRSTAASLSKP